MFEFRDTIERTYNQIWKIYKHLVSVRVSLYYQMNVWPNMVSLIETPASVVLAQARPNNF